MWLYLLCVYGIASMISITICTLVGPNIQFMVAYWHWNFQKIHHDSIGGSGSLSKPFQQHFNNSWHLYDVQCVNKWATHQYNSAAKLGASI